MEYEVVRRLARGCIDEHDDYDDLRAEATSADRVPGEIAVRDPRCFRDDGDFEATVSSVGSDRSADDHVLTRSGGF